jgi:hypothetical protein
LLLDSFLNYPPDVDKFPVNFADIATAQATNPDCQNWQALPSFAPQDFHSTQLLSRQAANQWKIVIPEALANDTITWYHHIMGHAGSSRLYDTLRTIFWLPHMRCRVDNHVHSCDSCQRYKDAGRGQGILPPREDTSVPFGEVTVNLVGPWSIDINAATLDVQALTIINIATTLSEVV